MVPNGLIDDAWGFSYDTLNRLTSATDSQTGANGSSTLNDCYAYDSFGNRTLNYNGPCSSGLTPTDTYNGNNQMDPTTKTYDAAGNMTYDSATGNTYLYDGEGRICAVESTPVAGYTVMMGYVYDADGSRVAKGAITSMSCDPSANGLTTSNNETDYILGPGGEPVTELAQEADGWMKWQRTYVYAGGALVATYDPNPDTPSNPAVSFRLTDWLGTLRATTDSAGVPQGACTGQPFGDGVSCTGDIPDAHHFTGKERDTESGNDYFEARYYGSSMGRFSSPDPGPWKLDDPQYFNMYIYGLNNPLRYTDEEGETPEDRVEKANELAAAQVPYGGGRSERTSLDCSALTQDVWRSDPDSMMSLTTNGPNGSGAANEAYQFQTDLNGQYSTDINSVQPGDAIFFTGATGDNIVHTGIVVSVKDGEIYFVHEPGKTRHSEQGFISMKTGVINRKGGGVSLRFAGVGRSIERGGQPSASSTRQTGNALANWLERWWFFNGAPEPPLNPHSTHKICDENGNNCH